MCLSTALEWLVDLIEINVISVIFQWSRELGFQSVPSVRIPIQACGKDDKRNPIEEWFDFQNICV